ncbi:MAG: hypothetical protein ACRYFX_04220 [Janthinobacterium lividum]
MAFFVFPYSRLVQAASLLGLAACQGSGQSPPAAPTTKPAAGAAATPAVVVPRLVEQPLGKSGFTVSLPATHALKTTDGADFLVHYFAPVDTTVRTTFTGGLYFGNQPQDAGATVPGC